MICQWCGSENTTAIEYCGPTGVRAPDGWEEHWLQQGIRCEDCGQIEEL